MVVTGLQQEASIELFQRKYNKDHGIVSIPLWEGQDAAQAQTNPNSYDWTLTHTSYRLRWSSNFLYTDSTNGDATLKHVKSRLERVNDRIKIQYFPTSVVESEMLDIYQDNIDPKANTIVGIVGETARIKHVNKTKTALAETYPNTGVMGSSRWGGQNLLRSSIEKLYWSRPDIALELGRIIGFKTLSLAIESPDGDKKIFEAVSAIGFNGTYHMIEPIIKNLIEQVGWETYI